MRYTVALSFTNTGAGHQLTKDETVEIIQASSVQQVEGGDLIIDIYGGTATTQGTLIVSITLANGANNQIATLGTTYSLAGNAVVRASLTKGSSTLAQPLHVQLRGRYKG